MTDKITKALQKLQPKERKILEKLLLMIIQGNLSNLDVKKLQGIEGVYRVRKGDMRIIFQKNGDDIRILALERRNSATYNEY